MPIKYIVDDIVCMLWMDRKLYVLPFDKFVEYSTRLTFLCI